MGFDRLAVYLSPGERRPLAEVLSVAAGAI
jgi:hypothetical protein